MRSRFQHCFCRVRAVFRRLRKQSTLCWCDRCRRVSDKNDALYWQAIRSAPPKPTMQDAVTLVCRLERLLRRSHQIDALMETRLSRKEIRTHVAHVTDVTHAGRKALMRTIMLGYNAACAVVAAASSFVGALHSPHLPADSAAEITTDLDAVVITTRDAETGTRRLVAAGNTTQEVLEEYLATVVSAKPSAPSPPVRDYKYKQVKRCGPGTPANRRGLSSQAKRRGTARARKNRRSK